MWSVKDSGVIVRKKSTVAGRSNQILYCLTGNNTGDLVFGLRSKQNDTEFYAQNEIGMITQTKISGKDPSTSTKSVFITYKDGTVVELKQNGDVLIRKNNDKPRLITRDRYTIIYEKDKTSTILHPNGGISCPKSHYVNAAGRGLKGDRLQQVPTLRKVTEEGQLITKRDDSTVIIE